MRRIARIANFVYLPSINRTSSRASKFYPRFIRRPAYLFRTSGVETIRTTYVGTRVWSRSDASLDGSSKGVRAIKSSEESSHDGKYRGRIAKTVRGD